jgi:nicotinate phosphoribosyltransferase
VLLADTYNTLKSGIPNAIKVFSELKEKGYNNIGIRIDSGDITYLTKKARKMLDDAGFPNCKIIISNSLDEYIIRDVISQGAEIDSFGVGERLVTSKSEPVFGGVYKLVAVVQDGKVIPRIKLSDNASKITNPANKSLWRLYDRTAGMAVADVITLEDEVIDDTKPYTIFHPEHPYKKKTLTDFKAEKILIPIFKNGKCIYKSPSIEDIKSYCKNQTDKIWDEVKRFENPQEYYVDLSKPLWDIKQELINKYF